MDEEMKTVVECESQAKSTSFSSPVPVQEQQQQLREDEVATVDQLPPKSTSFNSPVQEQQQLQEDEAATVVQLPKSTSFNSPVEEQQQLQEDGVATLVQLPDQPTLNPENPLLTASQRKRKRRAERNMALKTNGWTNINQAPSNRPGIKRSVNVWTNINQAPSDRPGIKSLEKRGDEINPVSPEDDAINRELNHAVSVAIYHMRRGNGSEPPKENTFHDLSPMALAFEVRRACQWQEAAFHETTLRLDATRVALRNEIATSMALRREAIDWRAQAERLASLSGIDGELPRGEASRTLEERNRALEKEVAVLRNELKRREGLKKRNRALEEEVAVLRNELKRREGLWEQMSVSFEDKVQKLAAQLKAFEAKI